MTKKKNSQIQIALKKDKLIDVCVSIISFVFLFLNWLKISFFGYTNYFSIFQKDMFDFSTFLGLSKIFAIITIITFIIYLISCFVDLKSLIPTLENVDVDKYSAFLYFGTYAVTLVFSLFGIITTEYMGISAVWFFASLFCTFGFILLFKPDFVNKIIK